jgi:hypothetical protein
MISEREIAKREKILRTAIERMLPSSSSLAEIDQNCPGNRVKALVRLPLSLEQPKSRCEVRTQIRVARQSFASSLFHKTHQKRVKCSAKRQCAAREEPSGIRFISFSSLSQRSRISVGLSVVMSLLSQERRAD